MKYRISAARSHGEYGMPVWFVAGDGGQREAVVPWFDSDTIDHGLMRMVHCGYVPAEHVVVERIERSDDDIDDCSHWWIVEARDEEETVAPTQYRCVPIPAELSGSSRFPGNASAGWWTRGVDDGMWLSHQIALIVYELMETDSAIVRTVLNSNLRFDEVASAAWDDIVSMRLFGAKRAARLCWVMEKHGVEPEWKTDMSGDRAALSEYQKMCRVNRKDNW